MNNHDFGFIVVSEKTYNRGHHGGFTAHGTQAEAVEEAKRLCRQERIPFVVYKPVALIDMTDVKVTELENPNVSLDVDDDFPIG